MKFLVTGGHGFLGTRVVAEIHKRFPGADVLALHPEPQNDIRNPAVIEFCAEWDPQVVFHLAAQHFVPWCREHPVETLDTNVTATYQLLQALRPMAWVFASSAAVYGLANDPMRRFPEHSPLRPVDVYGTSKLLAEQLLEQEAARNPGRYVAARLFNLVGPGDPVPHLMPKMLAGETRYDMAGLKWLRDYTHVDDAAVALVDLASVGSFGFQAVNVCTGVGTTGWDLTKRFGLEVQDDPSLRRAGGGHLVGVNDLLQRLTQRVPKDPFGRLR